ncbi:lipocalin family protein [Phenylobacterium sp. LjRoot225]|uniref:lipocalin family protein n=1 Tax=Phenylobacterium sp. LjRoot225 TaxID=3342285 RepID=UPI003ECC9E79
MLKRLFLVLAVLCATLAAAPATAAPEPVQKIELTSMMGRWYEVARVPNQLQRGCTGGASEWTRTKDGFSVVQSCHKGAPDGPVAEWRAKARVADPSNTKFRMTFFGGLVSQDYQVLDHRPAEGWLLLSTRDGRYMWLMSQKPTLPSAIKAQAIARIRQLGFDPGRLEFPLPARS